MTNEELIVWLRSLKGLGWSSEAADRIEALTKERDEAEQQGYANAMEAERKLHEGRITKLEAELAIAMEALEWFRSPAFIQGPSPIDCLQTGIYKANATIAKLARGKDDR